MKPIGLIRRGIKLQIQAIKRSQAGLEKLQAESLAYLGEDPDAAVDEDPRLTVPYVFAGYLGIAMELLAEALADLEKIKGATQESAREFVDQLRARGVLPARLPGVEIPELQDLQEAKMLAERAAEWPKQWMAQGYEKGILKGKRTTLIELAQERFGSLKAGHKKRIAKATEDQLKRWLKAVLTASTVEDVFRA